MADLIICEEQDLQNIADALREKNGTTNKYTISEMGAAVRAIESEPRLQNKTVTENGTYTADSGYDGLGEVTVEVEGSGGNGSSDNPTVVISPRGNSGLNLLILNALATPLDNNTLVIGG